MEIIDKMKDKKITRRNLLKGLGATAATGALAGCSNGDGLKTYFDDNTGSAVAPRLPEGEIKYSATPHNCGGGCLSKYYTKDGVVKRIVTDEDRPDGDVYEGKAQFRSCLRCRSRREWFNRGDRLTVPLKRPEGVARGDVANYERISWEQAIKEIVEKQNAALAETFHDPRAIICTYGFGDRTMQHYYMKHGIYAGAANGGQAFAQDLSYPQWIYTYNYVDFEPPFRRDTLDLVQLRAVYREGNSRADMVNADKIVIWAANAGEARNGVNTTHFFNKVKEDPSKEIVVIDSRYTMTAEVYADKYMGPVAGTDAALVLGMLHYLITETWNADGTLKDNPKLNSAFIKRYMHGFFDDYDVTNDTISGSIAERFYTNNIKSVSQGAVIPSSPAPQTPYLYGKQELYGPFAGQKAGLDLDFMAPGTSQIPTTYANKLAYVVPAGMSLSAYILGDDERLTKATTEFYDDTCLTDDGMVDKTKLASAKTTGKLNFAASGYPKTIGYNVNDDDPLFNKTTKCYGNVPKTIEWASQITGISEEDIKALAEMYATGIYADGLKVTTYHGAGVQRQSEGEQFCWLLPILCTATGQFGQKGRSYGFIMEMTAKPLGMEYGAAATPIIDKSLVTTQLTKDQMEKAKKEKWNAGFVTDPMNVGTMMSSDMYPVFTWADLFENANTGKSMWNYGKVKKTTVKPRVAWILSGNPVTQSANAEYATKALLSIDTLVAADIFMTPSVELADYILPVKTSGEKWGMTDGYIVSDATIIQPVSDAPGEAKTEFEIGRLLAEAISPTTAKGYKTVADPFNPNATVTLNNDKDLAKHRFNMFLAANPDMKAIKGWTFEKFVEVGHFSCLEQEVGKGIKAKGTDKSAYGDGSESLANMVAREWFRKGNKDTGTWKPLEPLVTVTGKVEAYCQMIVEEYEASHNINLDSNQTTNGTDPLNGEIYTPFVTMALLQRDPVKSVYEQAFGASMQGIDGETAYNNGCDYAVFMSVVFKEIAGDIDVQWNNYISNVKPALISSGMYDLVVGSIVGDADAQTAMKGNVKMFYGNLAGLTAVRGNSNAMGAVKTMAKSRRFVYPIPMYIPCVEGRHANMTDEAFKHPDPLEYREDYPCIVQSFHYNYRAHSVLNNVSYLAELYKKDANGDPAYLPDNRTTADGSWDDGVYEPVYINPETARKYGIVHGDRVKISNGLFDKNYKHVTMNGEIFASAVVTEKIAPYALGIGDCALRTMINGIDVAGCCNSLYHGRPSRIGFGMSLGSDVRVKIEKA